MMGDDSALKPREPTTPRMRALRRGDIEHRNTATIRYRKVAHFRSWDHAGARHRLDGIVRAPVLFARPVV